MGVEFKNSSAEGAHSRRTQRELNPKDPKTQSQRIENAKNPGQIFGTLRPLHFLFLFFMEVCLLSTTIAAPSLMVRISDALENSACEPDLRGVPRWRLDCVRLCSKRSPRARAEAERHALVQHGISPWPTGARLENRANHSGLFSGVDIAIHHGVAAWHGARRCGSGEGVVANAHGRIRDAQATKTYTRWRSELRDHIAAIRLHHFCRYWITGEGPRAEWNTVKMKLRHVFKWFLLHWISLPLTYCGVALKQKNRPPIPPSMIHFH